MAFKNRTMVVHMTAGPKVPYKATSQEVTGISAPHRWTPFQVSGELPSQNSQILF
jgi:hypothetical protein